MGLRCTVLGHAWSDPQIEREREESDAEVVTTVREFKECNRCGSREVVSENVEVTAQAAAGRQEETAGGPGTDAEAGADDTAVIEDAETGERTVVEESQADDSSGESAEGTTDDGAVILDDSTAERHREPGEWPEHDVDEAEDAGPAEPPAWPDHDDAPAADDEPSGAESGDRSGPPDRECGAGATTDEAAATSGSEADATADGTGPTSSNASDAGGHEVAEGEEDEVEVITSDPTSSGSEGSATSPESGDPTTPTGSDTTQSGDPVDPAEALSEAAADQESDDGPVEPTVEADVDIEVVCPNCGFLDEGPSPSLRGGDSCPKCRQAYLEEREM